MLFSEQTRFRILLGMLFSEQTRFRILLGGAIFGTD
jgi:hypothetical protein